MWNNSRLWPELYCNRRGWLLDAMELNPRYVFELAALDAVYWLQIRNIVAWKNEVRRLCGLPPALARATCNKIPLRVIEMWENTQLTNAEYRARRNWLINHLGDDPKYLRELGDLDEAFRKMCEAQDARNNKIRQRLDLPSKNSVSTRIHNALQGHHKRQPSNTFDFSEKEPEPNPGQRVDICVGSLNQ